MFDIVDSPFDLLTDADEWMKEIDVHHRILCGCDRITTCIAIYRRCLIKKMVYHSLAYLKRRSTVSYFVQYTDTKQNILFGSIELFFVCRGKTFALINHHTSFDSFSNYFLSSEYHSLLCKCVDVYFHMLNSDSTSVDCVSIDGVQNMCIVFKKRDHLVVTPLSVGYEHD